MKTYTIELGKQLNILLGYKGLKSFRTLYPNGGSVNAWGHPENSMHTLKHEFAFGDSDSIRFVDTHITYFKVADQTKKLNAWLDEVGAKSVAECIEYLKTV
jgi:hypothetical protein